MNFDATKPFSWKDTYPTPEEYAQAAWEREYTCDTLDELIEHAYDFLAAYEELHKFAVMNRDVLSNEVKVAIFDALMVPKKPHKSSAVTDFKKGVLRSIAIVLHRDYGLPYTRNSENDTHIKSAASVMAGLKIENGEKSINKKLAGLPTRKKES